MAKKKEAISKKGAIKKSRVAPMKLSPLLLKEIAKPQQI